ncbi:MAG: prolipoprotein diacylglyceryl transferase [Actinobacteria bacterium]|nr:prolipoprotein diacylglyceryl transferase [Actinomycetota bacterium]
MYPVLFRIGSLPIRTYGVIIAIAIIVGLFVARREAVKRGFNVEVVERLFPYILIPGIIGARIVHVLFTDFSYYLKNPLEIFAIWHGGLAIHGAIAGGILGAIWFVRRNHISFWSISDILAPALILGQGIGRIACLFSGDAYGKPTNLPWAITFNNPLSLAPIGVPLHPTQLYEAGWDLVVFLILIKFGSRIKMNGGLFLLYAGLYSLGRFTIEIFRGDETTYGIFGLSISAAQILSLLIIFTVLFYFMYRRLGRRELS